MKLLTVMIIAIYVSQLTKANIGISNSTKFDKFSLVSDATLATISCYCANQSGNVVLSGKNLQTIMETIYQSSRRFQLYIQNSALTDVSGSLVLNQPVFLVVATSPNDLDQRISILKTSSLWNIRQPHFILDELTDSRDCQNALDFLRLAWSHKLLFSIFVCHQNHQVMLYTFNPFTNTAPTPWISVNDSESRAASPWTLFLRTYENELDLRSCKNLHWDKTMQLNGFEVKALGFLKAPVLFLTNSSNISDINGLAGYDVSMQRAIYARMNVTVLLTYKPMTGQYIDNHGHPINSPDSLLTTGRQDVLLNSLWLQLLENCSATPQQYEGGLYFVLHRKTVKLSSFKKIIQYLGWKFLLATAVILFVTLIFFRYSSKRTISNATLEVVLLLANGVFIKQPSTVALRLFIGPILFYFLTFHGIFHGKLSALLTNPVFEPNLNTIEDLKANLNYKLYSTNYYRAMMPEMLKSRIHFLPKFGVEVALNNPLAVIVVGGRFARAFAADKNLHLSRKPIKKAPMIYFSNNHWPLQERYHRLTMMSFESGLSTFWESEVIYPLEKKMKTNEDADNYKGSGNVAIALEDVTFILFFLIISLCCASIVFFIEIKFWRYFRFIIRNRKARRLRQIRGRRRVACAIFHKT